MIDQGLHLDGRQSTQESRESEILLYVCCLIFAPADTQVGGNHGQSLVRLAAGSDEPFHNAVFVNSIFGWYCMCLWTFKIGEPTLSRS